MTHRIVCENLRSAYNVGNIIRTADALGRWVVLAGYTARADHKWVRKTALGAEQAIPLQEFDNLETCYNYLKTTGGILIGAELTPWSIDLDEFSSKKNQYTAPDQDIYLIVGNEVTGIESQTLELVDHIISIPMQGMKESLNVGQAAAICMWELTRSRI